MENCQVWVDELFGGLSRVWQREGVSSGGHHRLESRDNSGKVRCCGESKLSFFCKLSCVSVVWLPFFNQDEVTNACITLSIKAQSQNLNQR